MRGCSSLGRARRGEGSGARRAAVTGHGTRAVLPRTAATIILWPGRGRYLGTLESIGPGTGAAHAITTVPPPRLSLKFPNTMSCQSRTAQETRGPTHPQPTGREQLGQAVTPPAKRRERTRCSPSQAARAQLASACLRARVHTPCALGCDASLAGSRRNRGLVDETRGGVVPPLGARPTNWRRAAAGCGNLNRHGPATQPVRGLAPRRPRRVPAANDREGQRRWPRQLQASQLTWDTPRCGVHCHWPALAPSATARLPGTPN